MRELRTSPLSLTQHAVWLSEQLDPGTTAYHIAELYSLAGLLQPAILEQAFSEIIRRHEALRTVFTLENDNPVQVIHSPRPFELPVIDLSRLTEAEREHATDNQIQEEVARAFDLTTGPLLRPTLFKLDDERHLLLIVTHHLVCDGWSLGVLINELKQLYTAFLRGESDPLPKLPMQYADFVKWQRGEEMERHLDYWRRRLAGVPAVLDLPADRPRPASRSTRGARVKMRLPESLVARVRDLSLRNGGTLFMTLLAGFNILISRLTGRDDVVVGTPVGARTRTEFEKLIGLFVSTLVLRTDLSSEPSFLEVLRRVREGFLHAYEHQDVTIEMLIDELKVERSLSHAPLVQVFFNMLNFSAPPIKLAGLEIKRLSAPATDSKFDLTLYAHDTPDGFNLNILYSTDLFDEPRMRELLDQFKLLLEQVVEDPRRSITDYSLVTVSARTRLPDPARAFKSEWRGACHELFSFQAHRTPNQTALIDTERTWIYRELDERSNQLAHRLLGSGVQRGDAIAIYAHRSARLVGAMLGVLKAGAAFIVLDPAYPEDRLIEYLRTVEPRGWIDTTAAGELLPVLNKFLAESPLRCRLKPDSLVDSSTEPPCIAVTSDDLAYVAFTSGSSGKPKAVMGTHDSLTHYPFWLEETFGIGAADRFSMLSALSHDPLLRDIFTPLLLGGVLCIPEPELFEVPGALARWVKDAGISVANLTPAMAQLLTEILPDDAPAELRQLRHCFFGGDLLTWRDVSAIRRLAPQASCINLYGSTETQRALSYYAVPTKDEVSSEEPRRKEILPAGRGMPDVQLLVLNAKQHLAGIGERGEIHFRSPHLAQGYWNDPALTSERFIPNPLATFPGERLYKTGDTGRYLPDGNVEILGRVDLQLKIRGFRVEPAEIERVIKEHKDVRDCVVIALDRGDGDKQLAAYVVPATEATLNHRELTQSLRQKLPSYMIPSAFVMMKTLPLTLNGKVDRKALPVPDQSQAHDEAENGYIKPRTPIEETIAGILSHLLKLERVELHDSFFDLGGHSLLAMQLIARVRAAFHVAVPLRDVLETPTVAGLARSIERQLLYAAAEKPTPIAHRPLEPETPLSFSQEGLLVREWWEEVNGAHKRPSQLASAFRLTGPLDRQLLEQAINQIVERHDILRATFPQTRRLLSSKGIHSAVRAVFAVKALQARVVKLDSRRRSNSNMPGFSGGRKQIIRADMHVPLTFVDLRHLKQNDLELARSLNDEAASPFDYDHGPLLRALVVRLADEQHIIHFVLHHLISDAWSLRVFVSEVLTLYQSLAEGKPSPLPALPIQYADFARWQREWFRGEILKAKVSYWKKQFSGVGLFPELVLPFIRVRQHNKDSRSSIQVQRLTIPIPLFKSLKSFAYTRGATTYMLFMTALSVLLHRYTEAPKITIYTPFANRGLTETHGLIGWVSNVHVLSVDCYGNPAFSQLLERVRDVVLGAYAHQDVPYLQLVKALLQEDENYAVPRRVSEAPYVFFDYTVQTQTSRRVGSLTVDPFPLPASSASAGLAGLEVRAVERGDEVVVTIKYSSDVVDEVDISRMLSDFERLLQEIAC